MTWTYDDPRASDRDRLRFEIGDTDSTDQLLSDEEIGMCLDGSSTFRGALAMAARGIAARFHRDSDTVIGDLRFGLEKRAERFEALAQRYAREAAQSAAPSAGGIEAMEKQTSDEDQTLDQPAFKSHQFELEGWFPGDEEVRN